MRTDVVLVGVLIWLVQMVLRALVKGPPTTTVQRETGHLSPRTNPGRLDRG